jgi:sirohydrochlorin ferrochelatase
MKSAQRNEQAWFEQALAALREAGPVGEAIAATIRGRRIRLGFARQSTGACWFDWRRLHFGVFLNADYAGRQPDDVSLVALLAHEARHLEQGILEALSVRGELEAWQLQYDVLARLSAEPRDEAWQELRALDPISRADLQRARALMRQIAGPAYRIHWLPLWPLPAEVGHQLKDVGRRVLRFMGI